MLSAIDQFRVRLRETAALFQADLEAATTAEQRNELLAAWNRQVDAWRDEVVVLNRRIDVQNLRQPAIFLEIFKVRLEDELKRLGAPLER